LHNTSATRANPLAAKSAIRQRKIIESMDLPSYA